MHKSHRVFGTAFTAAAMLVAVAPAHADIAARFYTVQSDGRDFGPYICCFVASDEVRTALGPNGLPVYNPGSTTGPVLQDHAANGELLWFAASAGSATTPKVTFDGSTVISGNSYSNGTMYSPNGKGVSDANGFQTAVFTGSFTFSSPQTFNFTLGADDDALLFVDNQVVLQLGGVHGNSSITTTPTLSAGLHTFELFYADRQQTGASLSFSIPDNVIVTTPPVGGVPEPATWAMLLTGFGGVGVAARVRRFGRTVTA